MIILQIALGIILAAVGIAAIPYVIVILIGIIFVASSAVYGVIDSIRGYMFQINRKIRRRL